MTPTAPLGDAIGCMILCLLANPKAPKNLLIMREKMVDDAVRCELLSITTVDAKRLTRRLTLERRLTSGG